MICCSPPFEDFNRQDLNPNWYEIDSFDLWILIHNLGSGTGNIIPQVQGIFFITSIECLWCQDNNPAFSNSQMEGNNRSLLTFEDYMLGFQQQCSMIIIMSGTTCPWSHTWRTLTVPDCSIEGSGHPGHHKPPLYVILYLHAKVHVSSMIKSVSRTPSHWSHTWRTLNVPDWSLGGWGHPWCHGSSIYQIIYFSHLQHD